MHPSFPEILISRVLSGEASAGEIAQLNDWLKLSKENVRVFEEYKWIYSIPLKDAGFDSGTAFRKIEPALTENSSAQFRFTYISFAASLILFISLGVFYFNSKNDVSDIEGDWKTISTGLAERKSFKLSDGSVIYLNAESSIEFHLSKVSREVILKGEAFFDVSKDSLRPFTVRSSDVLTKVIGTSFNISSKNGVVSVAVATGSVGVTHPASETVLRPRQQFTWQSEHQKWWVEEVDPEAISPWRLGTLVFEHTRMDTAAMILEKWYSTKIYIQDKPIRECRITGRFKDETLLHVLDAIKEATGIDFTVEMEEVTLMGKQCK